MTYQNLPVDVKADVTYNLFDLASAAHALAFRNGFWTEPTNEDHQHCQIVAKIALIHTEVNEALLADEDDIAAELADIILRTLDLLWMLGQTNYEFEPLTVGSIDEAEMERNLNSMHYKLSQATQEYRRSGNAVRWLRDVVETTLGLGLDFDPDFLKIVQAKHEFNLTRPPKHGRLI